MVSCRWCCVDGVVLMVLCYWWCCGGGGGGGGGAGGGGGGMEQDKQKKHMAMWGKMIARRGESWNSGKTQMLSRLDAPPISAGPPQIHVPGSSSGSHHPSPRRSLLPHGDGSSNEALKTLLRAAPAWPGARSGTVDGEVLKVISNGGGGKHKRNPGFHPDMDRYGV